MRLSSWRNADGGGLALELERAAAELSIADDGSVRLRVAQGALLPSDPAPDIGREAWRGVPLAAQPREGGLRATHDGPAGSAIVEIDADPFRMRVMERSGGSVAELYDLRFESDGRSRIALRAAPGERFFGFGEKSGGLDMRGRELRMRNRDANIQLDSDPLYVSIPFFLGLDRGAGVGHARGVMLEAFCPSRFEVASGRDDEVALETRVGGIDLTLFPGPTPRDVLRRYTARVGRHPLPPLWALGHHQSRWSYGSERAVRRVAREIRAHGIPTDAVHLDIDYMDGYRVFQWHPRRFPNPKQLVSDLAEQGFRVVTIVDPGVKVDEAYRVYRDGLERDVFCRRDDGSAYSLQVWPGEAALPDFNRGEVRAWWGAQHRPLLDAGVAGIWNDMNEPAGWGRALPIGRWRVPIAGQDTSRMVQSDPSEKGEPVPHEHVRNLYGQQECRATREFLEHAEPERRPFVLTRSGYAGIQRHAAVWTGDNRSRWSDLRASIPMLLNLSVSGVPFCGADIGGFALSCTPELYARWIQLGAFYPFARTHSMWLGRRQEPWRFGRRVEAIARAALELRMRLLPYLYGLFREHEQNGAPVWRPLFFEFPDDAGSAEVDDQLMLGPSLLLAPVLQSGARDRELYLPPGTWLSWHDDARYVGPRRVRVRAELETLPIFVRAGSLLPTRSAVAHVGEAPAEPWILEVFPGADTASELVEDDGESVAYREGALARAALRLWDRAGGRLRLEIGRREGGFEIAPRPARVSIHACPAPDAVYLDGARLARGDRGLGEAGYSVEDGRVQVRFVDDGQGRTLEIDPAP